MSKEKISMYKYLEKKIDETKFILELIDLGYDITQSKFLGKIYIIELCDKITLKIDNILSGDKK